MLYLLAATLASALMVILLKVIKMRGNDATAAIMMNYVTGAAITFALSGGRADLGYITSAPWFGFSLIVGVVFMLSLVVWAFSAARSGIAITTISGRAAMAIPVIFAFVALGEEPSVLKIVLLAAIFAAMWLIVSRPGDNAKTGKVYWVLPLLVFVLSGTGDTLLQYSKKALMADPGDTLVCTGVMYSAAFVTALIFYIIEQRGRMPMPSLPSLGWGVVLGLANTVCVLGMFHALGELDGSTFFPLYYIGAVIITTAVGVLAFHEKLSARNYAGIVIALTSIVLLAML